MGVSWESIKKRGAVSKQVVEEMVFWGSAKNWALIVPLQLQVLQGPDGGSANKPVGTIWIAVATPAGVLSERFQFGNDREKNILRASQTALHLLQKGIIEIGADILNKKQYICRLKKIRRKMANICQITGKKAMTGNKRFSLNE